MKEEKGKKNITTKETKMANDGFDRFCKLDDELKRRTRNLKPRIKRMEKKIKGIVDPLERQQVEDELEPLRSELRILNAKSRLMDVVFFEAIFGGKPGGGRSLQAIEDLKEEVKHGDKTQEVLPCLPMS